MTIDSEKYIVSEIIPVTQSTMGYVAELALFLNKTRHEVASLTGEDLSVDSKTSATYTNTELRAMIVECFDYAQRELEGKANG